MEFQSTRPRGARQRGDAGHVIIREFQSTRPRGARLFLADNSFEGLGFNPRAHVGRDLARRLDKLEARFQSTRPRGARPRSHLGASISKCFNPRAHVGRDWPVGVMVPHWTRFNPRAHVGRDRGTFCDFLRL